MSEERRVHKDHNEYFNNLHWQKKKFVGPGEYFCSDNLNEIIVSETGAGVIVVIQDPELHLGGVAHILLPEDILQNFSQLQKLNDNILTMINAPLNDLIKEMKKRGAGKKRISVRLCGGSTIHNDTIDKGTKNVVFSQSAIFDIGLKIIAKDIGGRHCRRVHFFPHSGRLEKFPLRREADQNMLWKREQDYLDYLMQHMQDSKK